MEGREKSRILLFGRTGSGKSTVANMLARGHLNAPLLFRTSSSVRGETLHMQKEEGENMVIVDTVGLGESEQGSVSNKEAQGILYNFFTRVEEGFHYFAFVRKWGRNDFLDDQLWKFFRQAFKGAEENFVVIFTHFDKGEEELEIPHTKELLLKMYHPCQKWICVDFPDPDQKSSALKRVTDRRRARSAARLKEKLSAFCNPAVSPDVCRQLRVGRVLLLGRREAAKAILGNLLVKGNFLNSPFQELPFSMSPSSDQAFSFASMDQPFKEAKGRRWEVVDLHAFDSYISKKSVDERKLALTLTESIVTTLMQAEGFSHVVYVHESGQSKSPGQDELIDKMFWQIIIALLSAAIRDERLVLVVAHNGLHRPSPSSGQAMLAENARFRECKNLLHLDIPSVHDDGDDDDVAAEQPRATRSERLDTTRRIIEQVLQKEVDTQSTFFNLEKLSQTKKQRLIAEVAETFLTPVVKAMKKKSTKRSRVVFQVRRSRTLSELSSAYKKIVNKEGSDITVQVQRMWEEQKNKKEEGEEDILEEEVQEDILEEEEEQAATSSDYNGGFCESRQLVVGQDLDFCYVQMKCSSEAVKGIEVTVQSHDQGWSDYRNDHGTYRNTWTWGELAVLAPNGRTQIGERIRVYTNLHAVDEWQVHVKSVTDPSFLESIQAHHFIALYLRSCFPGWCNYTRYASIKLVHPS